MKRTLLSLFILLLLPTLAIAAINVGDVAPDFSLEDLNGANLSLSAYRGKVVLLNFWGTFCPPCRAEMPSLNNLHREMKDKGFTVIGLSLDKYDGPVRSLVAAERIAFPIAMDQGKEIFYKKYATFALPLTYLIDRQGKVVEKYFGKEEWDSPEMKQKIAGLLKQK